jgi:hypothetical protein
MEQPVYVIFLMCADSWVSFKSRIVHIPCQLHYTSWLTNSVRMNCQHSDLFFAFAYKNSILPFQMKSVGPNLTFSFSVTG